MASHAASRAFRLGVTLTALGLGCGGVLDGGHDRPAGMLPVDYRNPIVILQDDWSGDWLGEMAVLLANTDGPPIAGLIVTDSAYWPDLAANTAGWKDFLAAAQSSGLKNLPEVTPSSNMPLVRPTNNQIDSTMSNGSAGGNLIVTLANKLGRPSRPLVVVVGTSLTDAADAYLIDRSIAERIVVVAALGSYRAPNGLMGTPNGDMDAWAGWIVSQRLRFIQAATWYDQYSDVTMAQVSNLPQNPLGMWMAKKRSKILMETTAADQIALLSVALPNFVEGVQRVSPDVAAGFDSAQGPTLVPDDRGDDLVITRIAAPLAASTMWFRLFDPHTFGAQP